MEKIELQGNVGDEYCLVYGDKTLVIKLTDAMIVPDFVESVTAIADKNPRVFLQVAEDRWHHKLGYIESIRSGLAQLREEAFSFSVNSKDVQDNAELPKENKKTVKKKKQNDAEEAEQKVAEKQE